MACIGIASAKPHRPCLHSPCVNPPWLIAKAMEDVQLATRLHSYIHAAQTAPTSHHENDIENITSNLWISDNAYGNSQFV